MYVFFLVISFTAQFVLIRHTTFCSGSQTNLTIKSTILSPGDFPYYDKARWRHNTTTYLFISKLNKQVPCSMDVETLQVATPLELRPLSFEIHNILFLEQGHISTCLGWGRMFSNSMLFVLEVPIKLQHWILGNNLASSWQTRGWDVWTLYQIAISIDCYSVVGPCALHRGSIQTRMLNINIKILHNNTP